MPAVAMVMRALPRDTTAFTNRDDEIGHLVDNVDSYGAEGGVLPIAIIDGMAGVGKTSFAVHVGHVLASRFPDGQLFVNLNGHTPGQRPVGPADALASLLAADGVAVHHIPVGSDQRAVLDARAAMWRSRVADQRKLIILDNAASYRQIEPLLPNGAGCLVLVTSRRRLAPLDGVTFPLDALSPQNAVDLFARLLRAPRSEPDHVGIQRLTQMCGNLPLAISLLAAQLRNHPSWTTVDLERRLLAARNRLGEIRSGHWGMAVAFELSYRDLPPEVQRFFRRISLFPGADFGLLTAAAVTGVAIEDARRTIEVLYVDHLLEENGVDRYRLHDLLRDYGRTLGEEDMAMDRTEITRRAGDYYLSALGVANWFIGRVAAGTGPEQAATGAVPEMPNREAALSWLTDERANVLACIEQANAQRQQDLVVRLAAAMGPYLRQAGPWDQAADLHRAAARAAKETGDRRAEAEALLNLGVVSRMMGDYAAALGPLDLAVTLYGETADLLGQAHAANQVGIVHYLTGDYRAAEQAQVDALGAARQSGDLLAQANALADLGMVRRQTGRYYSSAEAQSEALALYRQLRDRYGQANALRDLGVLHCLRGDYQQATEHHRQALDLYRQLDDRLHQAYALNELGVVRRHVGQQKSAEEAHREALALNADLGDRFVQASSIRHLGVLHRLAGDLDAALAAQTEALGVFREIGGRDGEAATLNELGVLHSRRGRYGDAASAFAKALAILRDIGDRCGEAELLNNWGRLELAAGRPDEGFDKLSTGHDLAREIRCPMEVARALHGLGLYRRLTGEREAAEETLAEALSIYRRLGAAEIVDVEREINVINGQPGSA